MKNSILTLVQKGIWGLSILALAATAAEPKKLLVVTVTTGFRHSSIATAEKVLGELAKESGAFTVDYVRQPEETVKRPPNPKADADEETKAKFKADMAKYEAAQKDFQTRVKESLSKLSAENLKKYDGVIFANSTGDLPLPDPQAFVDWVRAGHALIGMHSASDTFHGFRPYVEMLGGEFASHGCCSRAAAKCGNGSSPNQPWSMAR